MLQYQYLSKTRADFEVRNSLGDSVFMRAFGGTTYFSQSLASDRCEMTLADISQKRLLARTMKLRHPASWVMGRGIREFNYISNSDQNTILAKGWPDGGRPDTKSLPNQLIFD